VRSVETQVALALARVVGCPEPATAA
jgi:hypothetical protein